MPLIPMILILAACQDAAMLLPELDTSTSDMVGTVSRGAFIGKTQELPVDIRVGQNAESIPDTLVVSFFDRESKLRGTSTHSIKKSGASYLPSSVPLPAGLETGRYEVELVVRKGGTQLDSQRTAFYYSLDELVAETIKVVPLSVESQSKAAARVRIRGLDGAVIRWTLQGKVLQLAGLGKGGDVLVFDTPSQSGTYELVAEAFPAVSPEVIQDADASSVRVKYNVIVSNEAAASAKTAWFSPRGAYDRLLLLEGNLRDWAFGAQGPAWTKGGTAMFGLFGDFGGYALGTEGWIESAHVPVMEKGIPAPQTWDFLIHRTAGDAGAAGLMTVVDDKGASFIDFGIVDGNLALAIQGAGFAFDLKNKEPLAWADNYQLIRLAIAGDSQGLRGWIFLNGKLVAEGYAGLESKDIAPGGIKPAGTRLGGKGSLKLLGFGHGMSRMLLDASLAMQPGLLALRKTDAGTSSVKLLSLAQGERLMYRFDTSGSTVQSGSAQLRLEFVDSLGAVIKSSTVTVLGTQDKPGQLGFDIELSSNTCRFTHDDKVQKVQVPQIPHHVRLVLESFSEGLSVSDFAAYRPL